MRNTPKMTREEYIRHIYGQGAMIVKLGHVNIVHLDHPSQETIRQQTEEVIREELQVRHFSTTVRCVRR